MKVTLHLFRSVERDIAFGDIDVPSDMFKGLGSFAWSYPRRQTW